MVKRVTEQIDKILEESNDKEQNELLRYIDKVIPKYILEENISMLKKKNAKALLTLIKVNDFLRIFMLNEVIQIENMIITGIYLSKYSNEKYHQILKEDSFFAIDEYSQHSLKKSKKTFKKFIIDKKLEEKTLYEIFTTLNLGEQVFLIKIMNKEIVKNLISSVNKKFEKSELLNTLFYSKKLRNHFAHKTFILDLESYFNMIEDEHLTIENKISLLFDSLEKILSLLNRNEIINRAKKFLAKLEIKDINLIFIPLLENKIEKFNQKALIEKYSFENVYDEYEWED